MLVVTVTGVEYVVSAAVTLWCPHCEQQMDYSYTAPALCKQCHSTLPNVSALLGSPEERAHYHEHGNAKRAHSRRLWPSIIKNIVIRPGPWFQGEA